MSDKGGENAPMAVAKSEDFHRGCREFANDAKKPKKIREIRPFALFAFHIGQLVKRLCYGHKTRQPRAEKSFSLVPSWFIIPRMKNNGWFNLIFLIVLAAGIYFIVTTVRDAVNQTAANANSALQPLAQANQSMQTQVAQLMNPTPTIIPDPVTYITEIRALARLETIQYSVEKVITAESGQGSLDFLFGDKLLFVAHGLVIAGIDMNKIEPQHMRYDGGVLYVTLPSAEVFVLRLRPQHGNFHQRRQRSRNAGAPDCRAGDSQSRDGRRHPDAGADQRRGLPAALLRRARFSQHDLCEINLQLES
ncbi:MAG: hypothetical protein DCC54_04930 [Anaerolineae bacterium]|nr:MAG: hypothetical protein DCC54_04930 [Anaerolineae bacterium]